jgi:hypothetical protein
MAIQIAYDQSNDEIDWLDEDIQMWVGLVNKGITAWASYKNTPWDELCSVETVGTIAGDTASFGLDDEFQMLEAVYDETGRIYEVKNIREATKPGKYFYVSGNKADGFELNLGWAPQDNEVGREITVRSYRQPTLLKKAKDVPEMRSPEYLVAYVVAELQIADDTTQYSKYATDAANILDTMRSLNGNLAEGQHENALNDDPVGLGGWSE